MKKLIKMPSIEQFRNIVHNVNHASEFAGVDGDGNVIYDKSAKKPTLTFIGTCKVHGTNSAACYNTVDGLWAQSKESIITSTSDNMGYAFFVESNEKVFIKLMQEVAAKENIDLSTNTISIYGEWAGGNIQKGVAVCNLPKTLFIFGVKISPFEDGSKAYWVDHTYLKSEENRIYNISDFPTFSITVDFNYPQLIQNDIVEMVNAVEAECPVGKQFGFSGIGEGIVFSTTYKDTRYTFKAKGSLHAGKSKTITLKKVDDEKIQKIIDVAEQVTPTWRLAQMLEQTFNINDGGTLDRSKLGDYIRLVINDIIKEDIDILKDASLEPKDVSKYISDISRKYFFEQELI